MQRIFLLVLAAAAYFVWRSSADLPPVVASHFGPSGAPNGFMAKSTYTVFMVALVIAVPALIALSGQLVRMLPPQWINLPHREYWLAPPRRAATIDALSAMSLPLAMGLVVFLCLVHELVVKANAVQPARLPETPLFLGLATFGVATLFWLFVFIRRFGRAP